MTEFTQGERRDGYKVKWSFGVIRNKRNGQKREYGRTTR